MENNSPEFIWKKQNNGEVYCAGKTFEVDKDAEMYEVNPYLASFRKDKDNTAFISKMFSTIFKDCDIKNPASVAYLRAFLQEHAGLEKDENGLPYRYTIVAQNGEYTIFNGKNFTKLKDTAHEQSFTAYSMPASIIDEKMENLPFINDIGQRGVETKIADSIYIQDSSYSSIITSGVVTATDFSPEAEEVSEKYHGCCVIFSKEEIASFGENAKYLGSYNNQSNLQLPYCQDNEGNITLVGDEAENKESIYGMFDVVKKVIGGIDEVNARYLESEYGKGTASSCGYKLSQPYSEDVTSVMEFLS